MASPSRLADRVRAFFAPDGPLSRAHPAAEQRPEQLEMALHALAAIEGGGSLVVEAGTGVGKTLAYLVPAVLARRRVIVSTGTKALQDQLALKDLPFLRDACKLAFSFAVLKGRDNYLCRQRFGVFRAQPTFAGRSEASLWPAVEDWARQTETGDMGELSDLPEAPSFWPQVNAKDSTCLGQRCPEHAACLLHSVRNAARDADIVVVNHHLYLADVVVRQSRFGSVLPDADTVIFDEAHRLESAATSFFGRSVSSWRLRELADDVQRELGAGGALPPTVAARAERLSALAQGFARAWGSENGRWPLPSRLPSAHAQALADVVTTVRALAEGLAAIPGRPALAEPLLRRAEELAEDADLLARHDDPAFVHWFEVRGRGASVVATPVDVSGLLRQQVFAGLRTAVLCSATLAIGGRLSHARSRLGLIAERAAADSEAGDHDIHADVREISEDGTPDHAGALNVTEAVLASPFSHQEQALLYLPESMPAPRHPDFAGAVARECRALTEASAGRAFLLFTSYENLRKVHEILRHDLPFPLLVQGEAPKLELLRRFRSAAGSVLFATSSFWEGIDVPGEALSLVVMDKLPFAVPSDPIVAARARLVEERGGDAFRELSVPEAILALKQGAGRLIRSKSDRGVVAILDPRVHASWGRAFLRDLPPFQRTSSIDAVRAFFDEAAPPR